MLQWIYWKGSSKCIAENFQQMLFSLLSTINTSCIIQLIYEVIHKSMLAYEWNESLWVFAVKISSDNQRKCDSQTIRSKFWGYERHKIILHCGFVLFSLQWYLYVKTTLQNAYQRKFLVKRMVHKRKKVVHGKTAFCSWISSICWYESDDTIAHLSFEYIFILFSTYRYVFFAANRDMSGKYFRVCREYY